MESELEIWAELDEEKCLCKGTGWGVVNGEWDECVVHYHGQLHPQSRELLLDEPRTLKEEDRKSQLKWQIDRVKAKIQLLILDLEESRKLLSKLEVELINRTKTIEMNAVNVQELLSQTSKKEIDDSFDLSHPDLDELAESL